MNILRDELRRRMLSVLCAPGMQCKLEVVQPNYVSLHPKRMYALFRDESRPSLLIVRTPSEDNRVPSCQTEGPMIFAFLRESVYRHD